MRYPESRYCIRRVRLSRHSDLVEPLREIEYRIERDVVKPVVEIPIDHGDGIRGLSELSMWEQLPLAAFLQSRWSDNQVGFLSATSSNKPSRAFACSSALIPRCIGQLHDCFRP